MKSDQGRPAIGDPDALILPGEVMIDEETVQDDPDDEGIVFVASGNRLTETISLVYTHSIQSQVLINKNMIPTYVPKPEAGPMFADMKVNPVPAKITPPA